MQVTKTIISFLVFRIFINILTFLLIYITFDIAQIFSFILGFVFFSNFSNINSNYWMISLIILLIAFVFLENLSLKVTYIYNKSRILGKLNFFYILIILIILLSFIFIFFS